MPDIAEIILETLTEQGYLQTRVNRFTKEQELAITDRGLDIFKVLKWFEDKEHRSQGWCQQCKTHTKDGQMTQFKDGNGNWYFLCQKCRKEYGDVDPELL